MFGERGTVRGADDPEGAGGEGRTGVFGVLAVIVGITVAGLGRRR